MPDLKVTSAHLERDAYLYIRQSTPRQIIENTAEHPATVRIARACGHLRLAAGTHSRD